MFFTINTLPCTLLLLLIMFSSNIILVPMLNEYYAQTFNYYSNMQKYV